MAEIICNLGQERILIGMRGMGGFWRGEGLDFGGGCGRSASMEIGVKRGVED
jgi:hypothetical protein